LIDETASLFDRISVSAGQRGVLVLLAPQALAAYTSARLCDLTVVGT
jgi:prolyl-tRNA editing enzyme YbaK/EbsC (Cys-tRNA(Pro) deacylase)